MAISGRKQLTYFERQKLFRETPRDVRSYSNELTEQYNDLIFSFTKENYQAYEKLLHAYKKVAPMLAHCKNQNVDRPLLELATIRVKDRYTHQRLIQVLRGRWTDTWEVRAIAFNNDSNKFWAKMAAGIQARSKECSIELFSAWHGIEGRPALISFLKSQFENQQGRCAISNFPMELTVGIKSKNNNKCSPDRKDSTKGYSPDNLWFVTWWVNQMKMDTPIDNFWARIEILSSVRNSLNNTLTKGN
jgi:hypothetical protein